MVRKSINKRISVIFIPMLLFIAAILVSIVITMNSYNKTFRFYSDEYYKTVKCVINMNDFMNTLDRYIYDDGISYDELAYAYKEELRPACDDLFLSRFDFGSGAAHNIELVNDIIYNKISSYIIQLPNDNDTAYKAILEDISEAYRIINDVIGTEIRKGNDAYSGRKVFVYVAEGIMIAVLLAFVCVAIYLFVFMRKKVIKPIKDITEWAGLFRDEYTDMTELKYEDNDEIADLVTSFNIVKDKLIEVKNLKKENEVTLRKLKEEEEYKKKFVKQLYDEKREKESISSEAKRDGLTGLYNRRSFDALIDEFIGNKPVAMEGALFLIDMDYFKNVNDTLGHLAGDEALKTLAGAMRIVFPGGYLGRYGGDEFIAFVTGASDDADLEKLGQALCNTMDRMFEADGKSVHLSVSVGIANTIGIDDYAELYMKADKALYYSKEHGRNQFTLASQIEM